MWNVRRHDSATGANVTEWLDSNKKYFLIGGIVLVVGVVAYYMWQKQKQDTVPVLTAAPTTTSGLSAQRRKQQQHLSRRAKGAAVAADTTTTTAVPTAVPSTAGPLCDVGGNIPKPMNVYQDNLSGSNDIYAANVAGVGSTMPVDYAGACSGVNPSAVWQSSQLLPSNCGQSLEGTSDWSLYAPSNYQVTSFLSAGFNNGQDTVMTTLKNASLDLRPEPVTPACTQVPFNQSSWVDNSMMRTDWSHSLVA